MTAFAVYARELSGADIDYVAGANTDTNCYPIPITNDAGETIGWKLPDQGLPGFFPIGLPF